MSSKSLALKPAKSISLFPSAEEWAIIKDQATMLVKSGLLPRAINTPEKAIAIAIKGRELGIPMMQAFSHIHIIDGKPGSSSELILSLITRNCAGSVVDYIEKTDKRCEIEVKRPGRKPARFVFTIEDARRAELLGKDNWKKYPGPMLVARAVAQAGRNYFADALMGMSHLAEELGAETDQDGQVIDIPTSVPTPRPSVAPPPPEVLAPVEPEKPKTRKELRAEIYALAQNMKLTDQELAGWVNDVFKKDSPDLTTEELERFLDILTRELTGV